MNIAQIIRGQIHMLDRNAMIAWGARELMNTGDGLKFKTSGMVRWKGYVHIRYDSGQDLYNIDFFKIRKGMMHTTKQVDGVFAEDMVSIIDGVVG